MTSQNNTDVRQSLSSQTIADLSSPRLSGVRYPYYGVNDYYPAATQQAVDDIINKYVRKGDQSPTKTTDPLRQSNYSPAAKALINAENTVNALRQSGVNPVVATDKAISETDLPVKYNLLPQGHLAGAWDRSQWWGPEAWRYGGYWPGYYPGWRGVDGTVVVPTTTTTTAPTVVVEKVSTPAPEVNLRASVVEASKTLSADEFYKKYGFYPSNWEGRYDLSGYYGRNWDGRYDPLWSSYGYNGLYGGAYGGRLVDGKWTDSRFEGKWVDGKWVEGKNVDGKWVDGKFPIVDSSLYGSRWWDSRYGYPYGTTSTTYPYGSVYPYSRVSVTPVDPLLVSTSKSDKTGYVRQYTQPKTEEAQPTTVQTTDAQSQNASRKASQQVDEERFDFENNRN